MYTGTVYYREIQTFRDTQVPRYTDIPKYRDMLVSRLVSKSEVTTFNCDQLCRGGISVTGN